MPHWDFKCIKCGHVEDRSYSSFSAMEKSRDWRCGQLITDVPSPYRCKGFMERQAAAPAFTVTGFNARTGYSGERTFHQKHAGGIRTEVKGNLEGFTDLL